MNLRKLALVLVIVLMVSVVTPALAKNPFADVPADHWAYDSVVELAAAGLIEGYPDGTYGGARMMTRYEAAMVFARALHRLEAQIADNNLLPELDKVKAELMAEIKAVAAAAGTPVVEQVVETKVVEKVIVERDMDEATLARLRAAEIAAEALGGDMAYLEARMLGLVDGIRYDVNQVTEQLEGVESVSMDQVEAAIAEKIQEALLDVAAGVKETTIVERVVSTTPELTEADVEAIAEALIVAQVQKYDIMVRENRELIIDLFARVEDIEADVAEVKAAIKELEKVQLHGDLSFKAEHKSGAAYTFSQGVNLSLNVADGVNVKFVGAGKFSNALNLGAFEFSQYRAELTSKTPISSLKVGSFKGTGNTVGIGNAYVLKNANYDFAGVAKIDIIENLTADVLLGNKNVDQEMQAGLTLNYKFMPEIGVKLSGALVKPHSKMFENYAAGLGLFGTIANVNYKADVAMDFTAPVLKDGLLAVVEADTKFGMLSFDAKFIYQEMGYGINKQLINNTDNKYAAEAGVGVDFLGINLGGRYYFEGAAANKLIHAYKVDASKKFDLVVPVNVEARFAGNITDGNAHVYNAFAKLSVSDKLDFGLRYGASAAYEKNVLTDVAWKKYANYGVIDNATFTAKLGYDLNWGGADVALDYDATFLLPAEAATTRDMKLTHKVGVGYNFTKDVKLTLGGDVVQTFSKPTMTNAFGYSAGLSVKF